MPLSSETIAAVITREPREETWEKVVPCMSQNGDLCQAPDGGLLIQLDSLARTWRGVRAIVTYSWIQHRPTGRKAVGFVKLRLLFEQTGDTWRVKDEEVLLTT
jgi:hypothetical protein